MHIQFTEANTAYWMQNQIDLRVSIIAGSLYSSETPSFTQIFGELNYSHDYHFSQWAHFTFGAGLIFNQTSQDFSDVEVIDFGDPSLSMGNSSNNVVDGSLGVKYFLKRFKIQKYLKLFLGARHQNIQEQDFHLLRL